MFKTHVEGEDEVAKNISKQCPSKQSPNLDESEKMDKSD